MVFADCRCLGLWADTVRSRREIAPLHGALRLEIWLARPAFNAAGPRGRAERPKGSMARIIGRNWRGIGKLRA